MPDPMTVTATWTTIFSSKIWKKLEDLKRAAANESPFLALGPTLPDEGDDRTAEVVVHHRDQEALHWALRVGPSPSGTPPDVVRTHNTRLGGRDGLSSLLGEGLSPGAPSVGSFRVRFTIAGATHRCVVIPAPVDDRGPHGVASRLGDATLEQVGYRFERGVSGVEEIVIIYHHQPDEYAVSVSARGPLKLGSTRWLPFADDIGELARTTFFLPREVVE